MNAQNICMHDDESCKIGHSQTPNMRDRHHSTFNWRIGASQLSPNESTCFVMFVTARLVTSSSMGRFINSVVYMALSHTHTHEIRDRITFGRTHGPSPESNKKLVTYTCVFGHNLPVAAICLCVFISVVGARRFIGRNWSHLQAFVYKKWPCLACCGCRLGIVGLVAGARA